MKKIIIGILLTSIFKIGFTQNDSTAIYKYDWTFGFINRSCDISDLNNRLSSAGISEFKKDFFGISTGISSRRINKKSYFTENITWLKSSSSDLDSISSRMDVFELSADMNIVLSKNSKWYLYPYFGLGIGFSRLKLSENITFNQSLQSLSSPSVYWSDKPYYFGYFGIGTDRKIKYRKHFFFIGLNIGYKLASKNSWDYNESPTNHFGGFEYKVRARIEL
jgi:hypothetical protein